MERKGFTLIELLVVIGIIAVLIALLVAAVQRVREAASRAQCQNNLKQLSLAATNFHDTYRYFPPGLNSGTMKTTVLVWLLPYVEQQNRFRMFDPNSAITAAANAPAIRGDVPVYLCPSDPSSGALTDTSGAALGRTNYYGNMGLHAWMMERNASATKDNWYLGIFHYDSQTRGAQIVDGWSNTAMFSEIKRGNSPNYSSTDVTKLATTTWSTSDYSASANNLGPNSGCDSPTAQSVSGGVYNDFGLNLTRQTPPLAAYTHTVPPNFVGRDCTITIPAIDRAHLAARSYHPGGVNVALCDGSVRFFADSAGTASTDPRKPSAVWQALGSRSGGEPVSSSD